MEILWDAQFDSPETRRKHSAVPKIRHILVIFPLDRQNEIQVGVYEKPVKTATFTPLNT